MGQKFLPWYMKPIPAFIQDFHYHSLSSSAVESVNTLSLVVSQKTLRMEINVLL
jgi:hypothetical protein